MAPLEQQWVKVQQKTFTKWYTWPAILGGNMDD